MWQILFQIQENKNLSSWNLCSRERKQKINMINKIYSTFPSGSVAKNQPANVGNTVSIPGLGRSPGEGNGNPLQYSCLGNPMDPGDRQATVYKVTKVLDKT